MAWSATLTNFLTGVTSTLDMQAASLLNEFTTAINERQAVGTFTAVPVISAGDDIQAASVWLAWQSAIQNNYQSWVTRKYWTGAAWAKYANPYFDNAAAITTWADITAPRATQWENFCDSAGCRIDGTHYGFRRVTGTDWPTDWTDFDDAAYSYGTIQAGDIIGPWLLSDYYNMLNEIVWVEKACTWELNGDTDEHVLDVGQLGNWAASKAAAGASWDGGPTPFGAGAVPFALTYGQDLTGSLGWIEAGIERCRMTERCTGTTQCNYDVDWYAKCDDKSAPQGFAAYGDGMYDGNWALWLTDAAQKNGTQNSSVKCGAYTVNNAPGDDIAPWCNDPTGVADTGLAWEAIDETAVLRFDVASGFDKQE